MILFKITEQKDFMNKLLNGDLFDSFLLGEAIINTNVSYVIDGHINKEFYSNEELEDGETVPYEFVEWAQKKSLCFELIKGKKAPVSFQLVLYLKPEAMYNMLEANHISDTTLLRHAVLNVKYDRNGMLLTTGIAYTTFVMDKTMDAMWDHTMRKFLASKEVAFEES